ncbi:MAG: RDD family protein [Clostridia bacterium]|nr:RDD family protein [Clostridia bacterium]
MALSLQKANVWKRVSAYLVDTVATIFLALGFLIVLLAIFGYDAQSQRYAEGEQAYYTQYAEQYDVDFEISQDEYKSLSPEAKQAYDTALKEAQNAIEQDPELMQTADKLFSRVLVSASFGLLASVVVFHFVLPLFFKNGQTLGKKVFGLAVMRTNHVKLSTPVLFVRSVIGLYVMETMAPVLLCLMGSVGLIAAALVMILQLFVMWKTDTNSSIHDLLADTVVVDLASQRIFETQDEMLAFRLKQAEENAKETQENQDV